MKILLCCSAGISTSLLVENMNKYLDELDYVDSVAVGDIVEEIEYYDIVVAGPHLKLKYRFIKGLCEEYGKKFMAIETDEYSSLNGKKIYENIKEFYYSNK